MEVIGIATIFQMVSSSGPHQMVFPRIKQFEPSSDPLRAAVLVAVVRASQMALAMRWTKKQVFNNYANSWVTVLEHWSKKFLLIHALKSNGWAGNGRRIL